MRTDRTVAKAALLIFQASLGSVLFFVYEARHLPYNYHWWPVAAGILAVPALAGMLFPTGRMLLAVLVAGAAGVLLPVAVRGDWPFLPALLAFGPTAVVLAALAFWAGLGVRQTLLESARWASAVADHRKRL